jgi:hypothetical protein
MVHSQCVEVPAVMELAGLKQMVVEHAAQIEDCLPLAT